MKQLVIPAKYAVREPESSLPFLALYKAKFLSSLAHVAVKKFEPPSSLSTRRNRALLEISLSGPGAFGGKIIFCQMPACAGMTMLLFLLLFTSHAAKADCPAYSESLPSVGYKASTGTLMACNGTSWISLTTAGDTVPAGAVMAFDLTTCPTGWSEYTAARGRFLRGIDSTAAIDPDGTRAPGNLQDQDWKSFSLQTSMMSSGYVHTMYMGKNISSYSGTYLFGGAWANPNSGIRLMWDTSETRPKNVAVLYCRKN